MTKHGANGLIADLIAARTPGFAIDQAFYSDPAVYARDVERVFMREWLYAGHASEIPDTGDYFLFQVAGESVIIVRGDDGEIRALVNVCRHRGSRVCYEARGNTSWFACPYHGWTYDLRGELKAARQMPEDFDMSGYGLAAIHAELFHGFIMINFADRPESLDLAHRLLDPALAPFGLERARVAHKETYWIDANWKLAVENYVECYHCAPAHPEFSESHSIHRPKERNAKLMAALKVNAEAAGVSIEEIHHDGQKGGTPELSFYYDRYALFPGYETGCRDGKPVAPLMGNIKSFDGGASDLALGALNFFLFYSDHGVVYRFIPHGIQSTECEVVWLVNEDAKDGVDCDIERMIWLWSVTTEADKLIIEKNQQGVNSRYYRPGPYSPMESWSGRFVDWYFSSIA
jgi:Rieske 2Fe-2S family protein